jgi:predicted RNA methylase
LSFNEFRQQAARYNRIVLDLGTGDGRYVHCLAERNPRWFVIGVDSCRENLHEHSRAKLPNMLFVIANAQSLPCELGGLISHITINFPWGSLLESLLTRDLSLMCGLESIARSVTTLEIRLNSDALTEAGTTLERGAETICENLNRLGWQVNTPALMDSHTLSNFPSTWARRLAHGRDPRAMSMSGYLIR